MQLVHRIRRGLRSSAHRSRSFVAPIFLLFVTVCSSGSPDKSGTGLTPAAGGSGASAHNGGSKGGAGGVGTGGVAATGGSSGDTRDTGAPDTNSSADLTVDRSTTLDAVRSDAAADIAADAGAMSALDRACTPVLVLRMPDATGQGFLEAMGGTPQTVEAIVQAVGRDVCRVLYRKAEEVRAASTIELVIRDYAGVAAKSGDLGRIKVEISSRHLQMVKAAGRDVTAEIKGILYHEMTHMYQQDDKPEGTWAGLPAYYESIADAVRIRNGFVPAGCRPSKTGQWSQHSYCSGGYWWLWVDTKHRDYIYHLNLLTKGGDMKPFAVADATRIAGISLDDLWTEYQTAACCSATSTMCCK